MALAINLLFLVIEFVGGLVTNSLALLSDAGHMLTDVAALGVALIAANLATRPPTPSGRSGCMRAEVIGAFVNGITLVAIVGVVFWEAIHRLAARPQIDAPVMVVIAVAGLIANAASAALLVSRRHDNVNIRGAFLHMAADALGSLGAIVSGVVVWTTGWAPADSLASMVIGVLILISSVGLLRQTVAILLNATPADIDYEEVKAALLGVAHFEQVLDLHIWPISTGQNILTAHIRLQPGCGDAGHWKQCLRTAETLLRDRFHIEHATLQLEPPEHEHHARPF